MSLREFMQKSDEYFVEARDKEVSAEFRIALGKLKGIYGNDEVPTSKVLDKDIDMIVKKYSLDSSFKEYAKKNIKINESEENIEEQEKKDDLTDEEIKNESAVGEVGRTSKEDAEAHITPELKAEFEKIIRQIGGKAVARALLDGNPDNGEITESAKDFLLKMQKTLKKCGFEVKKEGSELLKVQFTGVKDFKKLETILTEKVFGGVLVQDKTHKAIFKDFSGDWKLELWADGMEENTDDPKKFDGEFRGFLYLQYEAIKREDSK